MAVHDRSATQALRQIAKHGRWIKIVTKSGGYLPDEDDFANQDEESEDAQGLFTMFHNREIDGELIRVGDRRVLIAAQGLAAAPSTGNLIRDGSTTYKVVKVDTLQPGDTTVLYKVQVRK